VNRLQGLQVVEPGAQAAEFLAGRFLRTIVIDQQRFGSRSEGHHLNLLDKTRIRRDEAPGGVFGDA